MGGVMIGQLVQQNYSSRPVCLQSYLSVLRLTSDDTLAVMLLQVAEANIQPNLHGGFKVRSCSCHALLQQVSLRPDAAQVAEAVLGTALDESSGCPRGKRFGECGFVWLCRFLTLLAFEEWTATRPQLAKGVA